MSVIRDCESRKQKEVQERSEALHQEQQKVVDLTRSEDQLRREVDGLRQTVANMESDIKLHEQEQSVSFSKVDKLNADIVVLKQECSKLKEKQFEDVELIQIMRKQQDSLK
mmetsp:Transcript_4348/g.6327  ORF Transcript_4348/g.6327 Transcript_4348/m.6327 type:complete len:111 (+) Transcript_4348:1015-1347(+)|eukprot:CAMPEP_0170508074 /NCGR_PEP_ID=MMETSP0208-20121228/61136_1 /TAXON_ID=197538 /ORGANISM="Strombidium inclinatum, Strain S3" /LENGTH=110 /DNA_ID=CAMNT_0010790731 /DNA_START=1012 /DNA_END=1344 /DNA_ORIENTATION=-